MNPKFIRIFAVASWAGAALCAFLTVYLFHMAREYPGMEALTDFRWPVGVLALLWVAAAVWFTVQARQGGKKDK